MAEVNPPYVIDGTTVSGEEIRRVLETLVPTPGYVRSGELVVTQNGTPNMSVNVAAGEAFILGTEQTEQGMYHVYNDATVNKTIAASDPTNPRDDLVIAKIQDAEYSGATRAWSLAVVTGTPAASPADPAVPANSISLARVRVDAAVSSIVTAKITDLRARASGSGVNSSWGLVKDPVKLTSSVTGLSTATVNVYADITGLAITVTSPGNRYWRIIAAGVLSHTVAQSNVGFAIREGSTRIAQFSQDLGIAGEAESFAVSSVPLIASAGSHTYKMSVARLEASGGTSDMIASADLPAFIYVEDLGPA